MRRIDYIVIHVTATSLHTKVSSIVRYWRKRLGWKNPGYHIIIEANGNTVHLHPLDEVANGVRGYNRHSIHVSCIGGKRVDERTPEQMIALESVVKVLHAAYPKAKVQGHRDFPNVKKSCPRFDAIPWAEELLKPYAA